MNAIRVAFAEMRNHPLRTTLTTLAVSVAIGSVVTVGALLTGAAGVMRDALYDDAGGSTITIWFDARGGDDHRRRAHRPNPLRAADATALVFSNEDVTAGTLRKTVVAAMSDGTTSRDARITALQPESFSVIGRKVVAGRALSAVDDRGGSAVVVLGRYAAGEIFGNAVAIGREVRLDGVRFRVVGVAEDVDPFTGSIDAFVPLKTCMARLPGCRSAETSILLRARADTELESVERTLLNALLLRHPTYRATDFSVRTAAEILRRQNLILLLVAGIFAIVCGVCLLMGGIGLMNVLLSSVAERTREIGVRRAVGARRRDIFQQFVIEAVTLSGVGCVMGAIAGYTASTLLAFTINSIADDRGAPLSFRAPVSAVVLAVAVVSSIAVALVFGGYPAYKASRSDPADALRSE